MSDSVYVDRIIWRREGAIAVCRACGFVREGTATATMSHWERCYAMTVYGRLLAKDAENVRLRSNMADQIVRQTAIAAAERELRVAQDSYVGDDVNERAVEDRVVGAMAALRALGVEP